MWKSPSNKNTGSPGCLHTVVVLTYPPCSFVPKQDCRHFSGHAYPTVMVKLDLSEISPKFPKVVGPKTSYTWGYNSTYTVVKTTELSIYKVIYSGPISPHLQLVGAHKSHLTGYMNSNALYKLHLALLWNRMWGGSLLWKPLAKRAFPTMKLHHKSC